MGARLPATGIERVCDIKEGSADETVAHQQEDRLWVRRRLGSTAIDLVAVATPFLGPTQYLFQLVTDDRWFSLLPLLDFVREVSGWSAPRPRACFMFDDPNLHWPSYGYVRYQDIISQAKARKFHVSFATVPMDGWFVHKPTAKLFRQNSEHVSLLIHGNNHTHFELHRTRQPRILAAQALRRTQRLEQQGAVRVSRVMAAPHGACSAEMATALLETGFEAACISRGSLMARNPQIVWRPSVGMHQAEFLNGLPVLPRLNIRTVTSTQLRFALLLGQAVIPVGHHDDLRLGLGLIERISEEINALGDVLWTDMDQIAGSSYQTQLRGSFLRVKMHSRTIRLMVPQGASELSVERPWLSEGQPEGIAVHEDDGRRVSFDRYEGESVAITAGATVTISALYPQSVRLPSVPAARTPLRAVVRRQACELRDRLRPVVDRLFDTHHQASTAG
jgi:hypothetical protein